MNNKTGARGPIVVDVDKAEAAIEKLKARATEAENEAARVNGMYMSAVKGRADMRDGLRRERLRSQKLERQLARAEETIEALGCLLFEPHCADCTAVQEIIASHRSESRGGNENE